MGRTSDVNQGCTNGGGRFSHQHLHQRQRPQHDHPRVATIRDPSHATAQSYRARPLHLPSSVAGYAGSPSRARGSHPRVDPPPGPVPPTSPGRYFDFSAPSLPSSLAGSPGIGPFPPPAVSPAPASLRASPRPPYRRWYSPGTSFQRQASGGVLEGVDEAGVAMGNGGSREDSAAAAAAAVAVAGEEERNSGRWRGGASNLTVLMERQRQEEEERRHRREEGPSEEKAEEEEVVVEGEVEAPLNDAAAAAAEALAALALEDRVRPPPQPPQRRQLPDKSPGRRRQEGRRPQAQPCQQRRGGARSPACSGGDGRAAEDRQSMPPPPPPPQPQPVFAAGRSAPSVFGWAPSAWDAPALAPSVVGGVGAGRGWRGAHVMPTQAAAAPASEFVRRCASNRELGNSPPPPLSTSPYMALLYRKEAIEMESQQRLAEARMASLKNFAAAAATPSFSSSLSPTPNSGGGGGGEDSSGSRPDYSSRRGRPGGGGRMTNEARNRRRAEHNRAIIDDLCEIASDLFLAESRLLRPAVAGVAPAAPPVSPPGAGREGGGGAGTAGVGTAAEDPERASVLAAIRRFLSDLPPRYALGVEAPSEVLVHMRLMAAARADDTRAAVHIANLEGYGARGGGRGGAGGGGGADCGPAVRLVTISCADRDGLLEFITKLLGTGGARVLDADVMLTTDAIVLDRFVVEMKGRLRLDKLQQYIESYLKESRINQQEDVPVPPSPLEEKSSNAAGATSAPTLTRMGSLGSGGGQRGPAGSLSAYGPLYFHSPKQLPESPRERLQEEMQTAVPLSEIFGSGAAPGDGGEGRPPDRVRSGGALGRMRRQLSLPPERTSSAALTAGGGGAARPVPHHHRRSDVPSRDGTPVVKGASPSGQSSGEGGDRAPSVPSPPTSLDDRAPRRVPGGGDGRGGGGGGGGGAPRRRRRPLVNRSAVNFGPGDGGEGEGGGSGDPPSQADAGGGAPPPDRVAGAGAAGPRPAEQQGSGLSLALERRGGEERRAGAGPGFVPLVPFDELMLIETLGSGRVSTIYRAAWRPRPTGGADPRNSAGGGSGAGDGPAAMVALKVATVEPSTGDMSHVEELRREADIASLLEHNNICSLVGVASDPECFCLAYEFCEGGSLLSLLSDTSRCYEYLPIALDIANGMAYLHSRNIIHRDLKPSNILLTKDNRAKIADFGMSVANFGQELTAETGTYRWMAPEVIRHESYSSNADVYSFGIVLWQLITREVPFATLSPIQTAYAVAEGDRPLLPPSAPEPLQRIIRACWDEDSHKRPSFTYIAMALADYAKMAFSPANVGAHTVRIANEMLANVQGNSTVNVDFSTPVTVEHRQGPVSVPSMRGNFFLNQGPGSFTGSDVGLQI